MDTLKEGIEIISVSGKGNLAKWWRLFTLYEIPTFVCFDNDNRKDSDGNKRKDALKAIGIPDDEIEELLTEEDWNISDKFCVFGNDFEVTMRSTFSNYINSETEKKVELGSSSKHIIAREVASAIEYDDNSAEWDNFKLLTAKIKNLR